MTPIEAAISAAVVALVVGYLIGRVQASKAARRVHEAEAGRLRAQAEADIAKQRSQGEADVAKLRAQVEADAKNAAERALVSERAKLDGEIRKLSALQETATAAEVRAQRRGEDADRRAEEAVKREQAAREREAAQQSREKGMTLREDSLDRKLAALDERDSRLRAREAAGEKTVETLAKREAALNQAESKITAELARVGGLELETAKTELFARLDRDLATEQSARIAAREKDLQARQKDLAVEIVSRAIQRYAAEHTAETTSSKIKLPDEEYKGRIIGKEGRNIKSFEQVAGVDVIIDEAPDVIMVSCFDPVRREIAVRALRVLIEDGRIQPARIEEVFAKVRSEMDQEVLRLGEEAAYRCEVSGIHPQLLKMLGKLHYRTSYGQNVLSHVQEAAFLCGAMAADLGLDPRLGRRCGLLHDIGKAIDHEQEGSHPQLGYEALKRFNESETVANAALAHHEGHDPITAYTVIAAAADAISAARPGARRANMEQYLKRLAQLEEIAVRFPGVQKAYAIQAGREVRVIVNQHTVPDAEMGKIARDITRAIADQVAFPGEVKVTLIREMRHVAIAR